MGVIFLKYLLIWVLFFLIFCGVSFCLLLYELIGNLGRFKIFLSVLLGVVLIGVLIKDGKILLIDENLM